MLTGFAVDTETDLLPILVIHLRRVNQDTPHFHCLLIPLFRAPLIVFRLKHLVTCQGFTLAHILGPAQKINEGSLTRVGARGPNVERERPVAAAPPRLERAERHLEKRGGDQRGVELHGVAPRHRHRPLALLVVAEALLEDSGRVDPVRAHQGLH